MRRRVERVAGAVCRDEVAARLRETAKRNARIDGRPSPSPRDLGRVERIAAGLPVLVETREVPSRRGLPDDGLYILGADGALSDLPAAERDVLDAVVFARRCEDIYERAGGRGGSCRRIGGRLRRRARRPAA